MQNTGNIVELQDVCFSYGTVPVLEGVSLSVGERDMLGIIGPNGGGKTTLLKLMLGLLSPTAGKVTTFGKPPHEGRRFIGYVPQHFKSDPDFPITAMEVTLMGRLGKRALGRAFSAHDIRVCTEALDKVGMMDYRNRQIGEFSVGQKQRIYIARALATEPKLLLLDEPAASVDTQWQHSLFEVLNELNESAAIVLVTHDVSAIATYIDHIACVNRTLHFHGPTRDGLHTISEMYRCPMELIAHEVPHRLLGDHKE